MTSYHLLLLASALLSFTFASAEVVQFHSCSTTSTDNNCDISDVNIDPCAEASKNEPCKFKRGKPAAITFKYNPKWSKGDGELKTRAYWVSVLDVPFLGMDTDACKYTTCPIVKDQPNTYNYTLDISKTFPAQRYEVKFKLWEDKAPGHECCFIIKMKLV